MTGRVYTEKAGKLSGNPYRITALICSFITFAVALAVIAGWIFNLRVITQLKPDYIPMAPSTAILFAISGGVLFVCVKWQSHALSRTALKYTAFFILLFSCLMLIQFIADFDIGLERVLYPGAETLRGVPVGRMSPVTAAAFLLAGLTLLSLGTSSERLLYVRYIAVLLSVMVTGIGSMLMAAYVLGTPLLYGWAVIPVALPTSFAFLMLGAGLLAASALYSRIEVRIIYDLARGFMRSFLPVAIVFGAGILLSIVTAMIVQRQEQKYLVSEYPYIVWGILITGLFITGLVGVYMLSLKRYTDSVEQAKNVLHESEQRLRAITETAVDSIVTIDSKGIIVLCNSSVEKQFGYKLDELIGKNVRVLMPERYHKAHEMGFARAVSEGRIHVAGGVYEVSALRKDRSEFPAEISIANWTSQGHIFFTAIIRDITARKRAAEEHERLSRLESLGTLAGGIAHDFNNLLMVIWGGVSLLRNKLDKDDKAHEVLRAAEGACQKAKELSNRLLTFSMGGEPLRKIAPITRLLRDAIGAMLKGTNIAAVFDFPEKPYLAAIDEEQIRQVIENMTVNAKEAMPDGGLFRIGLKNIALAEGNALRLKKGAYLELTMKDSGAGMTEENLRRIFDPYFTTKEMGSTKGTGLGLAVCYSIIKKHEGAITVESKAGAGTTFYIYLPAAGSGE